MALRWPKMAPRLHLPGSRNGCTLCGNLKWQTLHSRLPRGGHMLRRRRFYKKTFLKYMFKYLAQKEGHCESHSKGLSANVVCAQNRQSWQRNYKNNKKTTKQHTNITSLGLTSSFSLKICQNIIWADKNGPGWSKPNISCLSEKAIPVNSGGLRWAPLCWCTKPNSHLKVDRFGPLSGEKMNFGGSGSPLCPREMATFSPETLPKWQTFR